MGYFNNGNYYRNDDDVELQWLEDGANLILQLTLRSFCLLITGICQLVYWVFETLTSDKVG
jgi:hypothetical protein